MKFKQKLNKVGNLFKILFFKIYHFLTTNFYIGKMIVKNAPSRNVTNHIPLSPFFTLYFPKILLLFFGIFCTLFFSTQIVSCHPALLFLTPAINYFSGIAPEFYVGKAIDKFFEFSPLIFSTTIQLIPYAVWGTGSIVVGTVGLTLGIKAAELGYNWRYFANMYALNTPILGTFLNSYRSTYRWWYQEDVPRIEYIDFFKELAKQTGITLNLRSDSGGLNPIIYQVPIETQTTITKIEPLIIHKHNEDVLRLTDKINELNNTIVQYSLQQANLKTENELRLELEQIVLLENYTTLTGVELRDQFVSYSLGAVQRDNPAFEYPQRIEYIQFHRTKNVKIKYKTNVADSHIIMDREQFLQLFPTIFSVGNRLANIEYNETRGYQTVSNGYLNIYFVPAYDQTVRAFGLSRIYTLNINNCEFCECFHLFEHATNAVFPQVSQFDSKRNALMLLNSEQQEQAALLHSNIVDLTREIQTSYEQSLQRNNPQDESTPNLSADNLVPDVSIPEPVSQIIQTIGAATALGAVGVLKNPELMLVLGSLLLNEGLLPLLHNPNVVQSIFELYTQNNMEIPTLLQDAVSNAQSSGASSYLLPGESLAEPNITPVNNLNYWQYSYIIGGVLIVAAGVATSLYLYKETKDPATLQPTFDVADSLKDFTKFK